MGRQQNLFTRNPKLHHGFRFNCRRKVLRGDSVQLLLGANSGALRLFHDAPRRGPMKALRYRGRRKHVEQDEPSPKMPREGCGVRESTQGSRTKIRRKQKGTNEPVSIDYGVLGRTWTNS